VEVYLYIIQKTWGVSKFRFTELVGESDAFNCNFMDKNHFYNATIRQRKHYRLAEEGYIYLIWKLRLEGKDRWGSPIKAGRQRLSYSGFVSYQTRSLEQAERGIDFFSILFLVEGLLGILISTIYRSSRSRDVAINEFRMW